ncbi:interferon gamma receptor 1-like [Xyrauchen texanus]|uniref:interferon gamma receptor 1-like n=1 Tax=Xyrauchen texanus TaxID=154827 RepID=UPI002242A2B6|nr:interferon gamma receptor 1-like [Xyrauchen texanus]
MFVLNTLAIMRIQIFLITLIFIHTAATEAQSRLSPPINVTIQCDTYGVEVRWEYPYPRQNVSFQVEVTDKDQTWEPVTTGYHSLNISGMLWNPAYNHYFVTVMAVWGTNKSEKAESVIFSFNQNAASALKCQLDFPEVKLSPKEGKLHLEFSNPLQLYRNTPALRNLMDLLEYSVVTEEGKKVFSCESNLATCETSIQFRKEREKYCVRLTGNIGQRHLKPTSGCYEGDIKSSQSRLSPPINVTIQCDTYGVEVRWEYPYPRQNVSFQVEVTDKDQTWEPVTTGYHSLNISSMLWNPAYNHYFVTVMAVWGTNKSEKAESVIFSFNQNAASALKCQLDFPEVKLSPKEGKLHLEFSNPLQLYRNTPALRNLMDHLEYYVATEEGKKEKLRCKSDLATCETSVQFHEERQMYCVRLTGNIGQRHLKPTSGCYKGDIKSYWFLYPVLGGIVALLFIAGLLVLLAKKCSKKIKKEAASAFPKLLEDFNLTKKDLFNPLKLEEENVVKDVQLKPLTCTGDPTERAALFVEIPKEDQSSDGPGSSVSSDHSSKNVHGTFNGFVGYESGNLFNSDLSAGYDCPQEMSPGDMVLVYGVKTLMGTLIDARD